MKDLHIRLADRPGSLAAMAETLGNAGVNIEGGGAWVVDGAGVAHFLVEDGEKAREALTAAGIEVVAVNEVVTFTLDEARPGELGRMMRRLADAGVNVEVMYSDHDHRKVLVVDDPGRAQSVLART